MIASLLLFAQIGAVQFLGTTSPDTVYVGQQVTYEGTMRLNTHAAPRFFESPVYTAPIVRGAVVYEFPFDSATGIRTVQVRGETFTDYTYRLAIFPVAPGVDSISVASLQISQVYEADPYLSKPTTLYAPARLIVVRPLPAGRPPEFTGAVGRFSVTMTADALTWQTGRAGTVRAVVSGVGNIHLVPRPVLTIPWAEVVKMSDSVAWDSTQTVLQGSKEFRWLVTPRLGGAHTIPPLRYTYFDATTARYRVTTSAALPITVTGPDLAARDTLSTTPLRALLPMVRRHPVVATGAGIVVVAGVIVAITHLQRTADAENDSSHV